MMQFEHAVEGECEVPIHRHQYHVDATDLIELLLRERVMQMAEVRDAQVADLEDKDRIGVPLGAAGPGANIGGYIAHTDVLVLHIDARRLLVLGPAAQYVLDARSGRVAEMRRVSA